MEIDLWVSQKFFCYKNTRELWRNIFICAKSPINFHFFVVATITRAQTDYFTASVLYSSCPVIDNTSLFRICIRWSSCERILWIDFKCLRSTNKQDKNLSFTFVASLYGIYNHFDPTIIKIFYKLRKKNIQRMRKTQTRYVIYYSLYVQNRKIKAQMAMKILLMGII